MMIAVGRRLRTQPPPPAAVFAALADPYRDPARPWLKLREDERAPTVLESRPVTTLTWSSLWPARPDAVIEFALSTDGGQGTRLEWVLWVDEPIPDQGRIGHYRKRLNELINAELRYSFGQ